MDNQLFSVSSDQDDDLEQVRCLIRSDDKPSVLVLANIFNHHRVVNGVKDVVVCDAMPTG